MKNLYLIATYFKLKNQLLSSYNTNILGKTIPDMQKVENLQPADFQSKFSAYWEKQSPLVECTNFRQFSEYFRQRCQAARTFLNHPQLSVQKVDQITANSHYFFEQTHKLHYIVGSKNIFVVSEPTALRPKCTKDLFQSEKRNLQQCKNTEKNIQNPARTQTTLE